MEEEKRTHNILKSPVTNSASKDMPNCMKNKYDHEEGELHTLVLPMKKMLEAIN